MDPALSELYAEGSPSDEVAVLIRLHDPTDLPVGVRIVTQFGHIATCRLQRGDIPEVRKKVASMKAARYYTNEQGVAPLRDGEIEAADVELRPSDIRRPADIVPTGKGVVLAHIDYGLDFTHPDFRDADGYTRVIGYWDQSAPVDPVTPNRYGYGRIYDADDINRAIAAADPYDVIPSDPGSKSHGTHVLGISAGNGRAGGPTGLAPEAQIIFVQYSTVAEEGRVTLGDSVAFCEAIDFIARTAGTRPLVINASLGAHAGEHDAYALTVQAMDAFLLAAPGRAIVQSAGNYFTRQIHAQASLLPGRSHVLRVQTDSARHGSHQVDMWYPGVDHFDISVQGPEGVAPVHVLPGEEKKIRQGGHDIGSVYHRVDDPNTGDKEFMLFLYSSAPRGIWTITVYGHDVVDGRFHAWVERDPSCPHCQAHFIAEDSDPMYTTGSICNGRRTIAVGAYDAHDPVSPLASFSSSGFTRDGRQKPDLVAPGKRILSASSRPRAGAADLPLLTRMDGTSMASPHVAGTVALMFQAARRLLSVAETHLLLLTATDAVEEVAYEREPARYGSGYLNTAKAVQAAAKITMTRAHQEVINEEQEFSEALGRQGRSGRYSTRPLAPSFPFQVDIPLTGGPAAIALPFGGAGSPFAFTIPFGGTQTVTTPILVQEPPSGRAAGAWYNLDPTEPLSSSDQSAYVPLQVDPTYLGEQVLAMADTYAREDKDTARSSSSILSSILQGLSIKDGQYGPAGDGSSSRSDYPSATALFNAFVFPDHPLFLRKPLRSKYARSFEVIALPGSAVDECRLQTGDLLLRVARGEGWGHIAVVAGSELCRHEELAGAGLRGEGYPRLAAGTYVQVVEVHPRQRTLEDRFARRVGDAAGEVLGDTLILRQRSLQSSGFDEDAPDPYVANSPAARPVILNPDESGPFVKEAQQKLNRISADLVALGLTGLEGCPLKETGRFNAPTRLAVMALQQQVFSNPAQWTGLINQQTWVQIDLLAGQGTLAAPASNPAMSPATVDRSTSEYIRWLQGAINQVADGNLAIDGVNSPQTRAAVRAFQRQQELIADGIAGPSTETALIAAGAAPPPRSLSEDFDQAGEAQPSGSSGGCQEDRCTSSYIEWMQKSLNNLGNHLKVTGVLTQETIEAIEQFKKDYDLPKGSYVSPAIEQALLQAGATPPPPVRKLPCGATDSNRLVTLLRQYASDIPAEYLLGWITVESGGKLGDLTSKCERGYFQISSGEAEELKILDFDSLSTDPALSVAGGIKLVRKYAHRAKRLSDEFGLDAQGDFFWALVKLHHWIPTGPEKILARMRHDSVAITDWSSIQDYVHSRNKDDHMGTGRNPRDGVRGVDHYLAKVVEWRNKLAAAAPAAPAAKREAYADRAEEEKCPYIDPDGLSWSSATPDQMSFMRRVYLRHVSNSCKIRAFVGKVPKSQLEDIERGVQALKPVAESCKLLLSAARAALATTGTKVSDLGAVSGYRPASDQFAKWSKHFPKYLAETQAEREATRGGEFSDKAIDLLANYISSKFAAPGYSLHDWGLAIDFSTTEGSIFMGPSTEEINIRHWRHSWFFGWLDANAERYGFFQNLKINEPWHWEYRNKIPSPDARTVEPSSMNRQPSRESFEPAYAEDTSTIAEGNCTVDYVSLLKGHRGNHPDLILRWNEMTNPVAIDVVIHLHGFNEFNLKLKELSDSSGLDFSDPELGSSSGPGRVAPTLCIMPRGDRKPKDDPNDKKGQFKYLFPAFDSPSAIDQLIDFSFEEFKACTHLDTNVSRGRLILTAHSGGGAGLMSVLKNHVNPVEIYAFDALYDDATHLVSWVEARIAVEIQNWRSGKTRADGALCVLYRFGEVAISKKTGERYIKGTQTQSERVGSAIRRAIKKAPVDARPILRAAYRVLHTSEPHKNIPRKFGWKLLADAATTSILSSSTAEEFDGAEWSGSLESDLADYAEEARSIETSGEDSGEPITSFADRVKQIAETEWDFFGRQARDLDGNLLQKGRKEYEDGCYQRIGKYFLEGTNTHGIDGRTRDWAWSAAFISWVIKGAGAGDRFHYSRKHSVYIAQAIRDKVRGNDAGYWGWRLNEIKPSVGDLLCWQRQEGIDYDNQSGGDYKGHCDLVVDVTDRYITVIGGNVGDSVTARPIRVDELGFVLPRTLKSETIIAIMQNRIA